MHAPAGADGVGTNADTRGAYQRAVCKMKERRKKESTGKCEKVGIDKSKYCFSASCVVISQRIGTLDLRARLSAPDTSSEMEIRAGVFTLTEPARRH